MVRVGRDLKAHLVPTPLPSAGTPSTRPGCSELHPAWPWTLPGRGHPQLLWATCSSVSPPSWWRRIHPWVCIVRTVWFYSSFHIYQHSIWSALLSPITENWDLSAIFQSPFGFTTLNNQVWLTVASLCSLTQITDDSVEHCISLNRSTRNPSVLWRVTVDFYYVS